MKKSNVWFLILSCLVALVGSIVQAAGTSRTPVENIAAICAAGGGKTWVALYEDSRIGLYLTAADGTREKSFSLPRKTGDGLAQVAHMAVAEDGRLFLLREYTDAESGAYGEKQELVIYTPKLFPIGRLRTVPLAEATDEERIRYTHLHLSTSLLLTGVSEDGSRMVRKALDVDSLTGSGTISIKNRRSYPVDVAEGLYKAAAVGTDMVYLSKSGKLFLSGEDREAPVLLYPDPQAEYASYVSFLCESADGQVVIGEQKTGHILRLTTSGSVEYVGEGSQAFGNLPYTCGDVLEMSFSRESDAFYAATVQNGATGDSGLLVCRQGEFTLITRLRDSPLPVAGRVFRNSVLYLLAIVLCAAGVLSLRKWIAGSRRLLVKLLFASVPLLVLALVLFGAYSFYSYQNALNGTYRTKTEDQGNLLRALFASASFDKLTAPQLYTSTEYEYLRAQMATRDLYTSSAYYVDGALYTGVDAALPCLYPFGILYSSSARALYLEAALTGRQQSGLITDRYGERVACVTPVGSSSGNTVFLLETSIFSAEIEAQATGFLRSYLAMAALCLLLACALLLASLRRRLSPLAEIIDGLELFSKGERSVRLATRTNDELADISRVFNKMAGDIDVQLYNLRAMSETYYRFVPRQIFLLLGKDNLADVSLDSRIEGTFCVLAANLYLHRDRMGLAEIQELTNHFFAVVHQVATESGATLLSDGAGLQRLRIICAGGDDAVQTVIQSVARIDEFNSRNSLDRQLNVSFLLHRAEIGFGVCGDLDRYVPALISMELEQVLGACEEYRRLASRLLVTGEAHGALEADRYFHRFIGYAGDSSRRIGLYDFYDTGTPGLIRLLNNTKGTFDKAVELYQNRRYYDAKNLFAVVLRENQYDNVARHYVFQCEKKL